MDNIHTQSALSVEYKVDFGTGNGKQNIRKDATKKKRKSSPKLPHVTRLLALAHHLQGLVDKGVVGDYADIARLSNLTRARLSQIMNLTLLAPQIQEEILYFKYYSPLSNDLKEQTLRVVLKSPVWKEQIRRWKRSKESSCPPN